MDERYPQCFRSYSGPTTHLQFPTHNFMKVVDKLRKNQPGLHPHFLSLWPDALCREALQCVVDELQAVREEERFHEISYQLVSHLHLVSRHGIKSFEHEGLLVSILTGQEGPTRRQGAPQEEGEKDRWLTEGDLESEAGDTTSALKRGASTRRSSRSVLVEMKETEAAGFVRGIDRLTRIVGMPWYSGLVVAGCMLSLRHEMNQIGAFQVESTFEMAKDERGRINSFTMMSCLLRK